MAKHAGALIIAVTTPRKKESCDVAYIGHKRPAEHDGPPQRELEQACRQSSRRRAEPSAR